MAKKTKVDRSRFKPCPFCGAYPQWTGRQLQCVSDRCAIQPFTNPAGERRQTKAEAKADWNRRAAP